MTGRSVPHIWDAGQVLQGTIAADRNIKTYKSGSATLIPFTDTNITAADLGVTTTTRRNEVVGYIRGESDSPDFYNKDNWKLGDTFRSNPITVGTPSLYYRDFRDGVNAFSAYRTTHGRTSANGKRIVVAGSNDGQLHAFRTNTGAEAWSFIPPNVLSKLKDIAHKSHPTGLTHQYFIDGPISVADVWLGTGDGTAKSPNDWHTLLIFGEGRASDVHSLEFVEFLRCEFPERLLVGLRQLLRLLRPGHHGHREPALQMADRADCRARSLIWEIPGAR